MPTHEQKVKDIINKLSERLFSIKESLREKDLTESVFNELSRDAKKIQDKINQLFSKSNFITKKDIDEAYLLTQAGLREKFETNMDRNRRVVITFVVLVVGTYLFVKLLKR